VPDLGRAHRVPGDDVPRAGASARRRLPLRQPGCLVRQFEHWRPHLTSVAYSMLGSLTEAEDAVQEAWFRLDRSHPDAISDLRAWLTTVVGRISLDMLRARKARPVDPVGAWLPEPLVTEAPGAGPESQSMLADSVGLALLVVLESLTPAERLAFVLHDVFAMPFGEIGRIVNRTPEAARQLASRARRRVRSAPQPDTDLALQRRIVDAFLAAARGGDFAALLDVLDPDAVLRFDLGPDNPEVLPTLAGAEAIARHIVRTAPRYISLARPVWVNGAAGALFGTTEDPLSVLWFTVSGGRIAEMGMVADPAKLRHLAVESRPG
jgi:RNA polymerase sigma factor (sigma-70 family)